MSTNSIPNKSILYISKRIVNKSISRRINPKEDPSRCPSQSPSEVPPDQHSSNVTASKASIIRTLCGQIFQDLYDASDKFDDEMLQLLSFELAKQSHDTIKRKMSCREDITSSKKNSGRRIHSSGSLKQAINLRIADLVEKDVIPRPVEHSIHDVKTSNKNGTGTVSSKHALHLFATLPSDDGQYDTFLNICAPDLMTNHQQLRRNFIAFKRSDTNVPYLLLTFLCGAFFLGTGFAWFMRLKMYIDYPTASLSAIFAIICAFSFCWVLLNRIVFLSYRYNIVGLQKYHDYVTKLYDSSYGQLPDNMTIVCAALCLGFYLINIVMMGWCDPDIVVNVNQHHGCDRSSIEPPPESFVLTMIFILLLQIAARGVSRIALVCSWIICLVSINVSMYLSNNGSYVWMNVLQILILCASYEFERQPLRQFIKTLKAIEESEMAAKLKVRLAAYETLQASEALKAKCSLVRHIGHEIRTPLNVVGVGIDMLHKELAKHGSAIPDEVKNIVNEIQEASSASLEVVNELLMFEKLAAGMTTLECVPTVIVGFLEQSMKQHFLPARAKNITFELIPSNVTRNVAIDVDPIKLVTVFRNLFSNAIKFTKKQGRVSVRVEVKKVEDMEIVEVTVQDTGAGLSKANLGRLFGEGVQFNANGLQGGGGSGLGLFISKGIVQLHKHGKIWAESEGEGFGCTFFVQLPLHSHDYVTTPNEEDVVQPNIPDVRDTLISELNKSSTSDKQQQQQQQDHEKQSELIEGSQPVPVQSSMAVVENTWKPTILVVDDSSMNRKMLVRMLISQGFACCEAEDGVEALSEMSAMYVRKSVRHGVNNLENKENNNGSIHVGVPVDIDTTKDNSSTQVAAVHRRSSQIIRIGSYAARETNHRHFAIDAVLIDSNMPRMNGPEAITEMRKMGFHGPIIGVSGGDETTMKEFIAAGANNVMQKPAQSDKLVGLLLSGFHLVLQEGLLRHDQSSMDGNHLNAPSEDARRLHIQRLRTFIEKSDGGVKK